MSATADLKPVAAVAGHDPVRGTTWAHLRPLVLRLHFYAGILVGPFVIVAAVTGLLYTAAPQIEQIAYRDLTHVTPGAEALPMSRQVEAARDAHPTGKILEIDPPEAPDRSTRVVFSDRTVPADYAMSVFVDPYDARAVGQVRSFGQWLGFRAWLDELHRNLHLGALGRNYSELAASWTWVVLLGGVALWVGRRRRDSRRRRLVVPDLTARGRARHLSWHGVLGIWLAVGMLGLSVTGLTWSRYAGANIGELRTALSWQSPGPATAIGGAASSAAPGEAAPAGATRTTTEDAVIERGVGVDGVLATARAQGLGNPLVLTPPADDETAWTAGENKRSWPTQYDTITVDPGSGRTVDRVDFASWPLMAKVTDWTIGAHMGILLGVWNQLALAALALGLIVVALRGYRMWWLRRPTRAGGLRFGPAYARGTWRRLSRPALVGGVVLTALVCWLVPLLGVSLVGFLLVDALVGVAVRRRAETRTAPRADVPAGRRPAPG